MTTMTEEAQGRRSRRTRLWILAAALTVLAAIIIIPPLVSVNRYKSRIAQAMSSSLGRPVHLSGVELRLLPRPGFVITDLTVEEDPEYGVEPVLHANEVTAAVRLWSLWRGRLEISRISVDEASLNLVHTATGRWNLDTLFRTAAQSQADGPTRRRTPLPYLEATNSRINIKQGIEKLPYSLVNADLSFWQEEPGDWRVRLKGQPARTDVSLDLGDTGIVQLEGRMRRAAEMRLMPVHVEMEWRDAQLGQLSRLLLGSDPGWRGDLTAQMRLDGTADSAQVTTRLRATGVHRAEFAPATPLDFDANCGFTYRYSARTIQKLVCDSPLGDGRLRVEGDLPSDAQPKISAELQKIPAQAVLDALRTVRNQFGAGLTADGTLSGKLTYDPNLQVAAAKEPEPRARSKKAKKEKAPPVPQGPLSGSITLDALSLSGGNLNPPVRIAKMVFAPAVSADGETEVLTGTANLPAGAPTPLAFTVRVKSSGYEVSMRGEGTPARVRQLAQAAGLSEAAALDAIAGDPVSMDLSIQGPWLPPPEVLLAESEGVNGAEIPELNAPAFTDQTVADRLTGTVTLHNANWKSGSLATAVEIPSATLHLNGGAREWDPVEFAYGPLKGTARIVIPACVGDEECVPTVNLDFPTLNAAELQATLLGSDQKSNLLSAVIARLTPSSDHKWPVFQGTIKAGSFTLGPVTLNGASADLKVSSNSAELTSVDAGFLGGQVHLTGKVENGDKADYTLEGQFQKLNPADLCRLLELKCTGSSIDGDGKVELAGYAGKDLAGSANGTLHFVWKKGGIGTQRATSADASPPVLARFDTWTADAQIAGNSVTLKDNQVQQGKRTATVNASVTFGVPPKISFGKPKNTARK